MTPTTRIPEEPRRIQRQRTKGWRMPEGAVYVGRPSMWGNPYVIGEEGPCGEFMDREHGIEHFRNHLEATVAVYRAHLRPLRGRDLVCWCPLDEPCHADVLLELANR